MRRKDDEGLLGLQPERAESATGGEVQASAIPARRKPYQRPVVQKRRSLRAATLQSGGAVGGTLGGTGL